MSELPRPGVSVIQQFRTVSPTIVTPTLMPCVVGPCFQVVEALETDSTGNSVVSSDAVAAIPPMLTSTLPEDYTGLDGLELDVSINGSPAQTVVFADPTAVGLTADQVKSQILSTSGISGWAPYVIEAGASKYLQLRGDNAGDGQSLKVLSGSANVELGFADNFEVTGFSSYVQDERSISQKNFPDPRENIDEIDVDEDSIRVFLNNGSSLIEALRDETFLRNGATAFLESGDISVLPVILDGLTLKFTRSYGGAEETITFEGYFNALHLSKVVPGSAYVDPGTDTVSIQKETDTPVLVTFASPADIDAAVVAINAAWDAAYSGETVAYRSDNVGNINPAGTYISYSVAGSVITVLEEATGNAYEDLGFVAGSNRYTGSLLWYINQALGITADPNEVGIEGVFVESSSSLSGIRFYSYAGYISIGEGTANTLLQLADGAVGYTINGVDDGDGDTKSPLIEVPSDNFLLPSTAAQIVGTTTLDANVALHKKTFVAQLDGQPPQEIEFNGGPIVPETAVTDPITALSTLHVYVNGNHVTGIFMNPTTLAEAIDIINTAAGQVVCYRSDNAGVAAPAGTYISFQVGGATDAGGSIYIDLDASTNPDNLGFTGSGIVYQTLTQADVVEAIDGTFGTGFSSIVSNAINLDSADLGDESKIEIGTGTANTLLGLTDGDVERGRAFAPYAGDYVYADGEFVGMIVQVAPGAVSDRLRLDREVSYDTFNKRNWYIQAKAIADPLPADRPTPDLVVDTAGDITIKADILRDTLGAPISSAVNPIIVAYKALRLDVTSSAENAALLTFEDTDELDTALSPLNVDNPLGLGLFLALLNAPTVTVSGLGVNAVSADSPFGTLTAYSKAMTFLESEEVYALAPLTQEAVVHQAWMTHVNAMADPDARGERIVLINPEMPSRNLDTLVGSGTDGDTTGVTNEFETKLSNISALLLAAGIDPSGTITVDDGVFLDIATDGLRYSVSSVSGSVVSLRVAFAPGENDDGYYSTSNLPTQLISETFALYVRGLELLTSDGDTDYAQVADTYSALGQTYADRRVVMTAPAMCGISIDGLEQLVEGFYLNCGIAGMIGQQPPQQGFTNFPMTGYTRTVGSNDAFSATQMNTSAAGGLYWVVQEVANGPLTSRHQLTTDVSSIEKRELSITRVVDYTAKFMRAGLRNFIGKFNITQGFLDTLSTVVQGQLTFLSDTGVLIGGDLNNIVQDTTAPDTVLIDCTLDVPYPCNYIRLTLVV